MAKFLAPERVDRERVNIIESEKHPVTDQWRALLLRHFRGDYTHLVLEYGEESGTKAR